MKIAIVGSREDSRERREFVYEYVRANADAVVIVTGDCPTGVDKYARDAATRFDRMLIVCHAAWDRYGKAAGSKRNALIVEIADRVVALPGHGRGTHDAIRQSRAVGKDVMVVPLPVVPCGQGGTP